MAGPRPSRPQACVPIDTNRWLLNLTGALPEQQPRLLHDELGRLPHGGAVYVIAHGEPGPFSSAVDELGGYRPEWRTVLASGGLFEAVVSRP